MIKHTQTIRGHIADTLSVFDHFVVLALKRLTIVIEASFKDVFANAVKKYIGTFFIKAIPKLKSNLCSKYISAKVQIIPESSKSAGFLKPGEKYKNVFAITK